MTGSIELGLWPELYRLEITVSVQTLIGMSTYKVPLRP